MKPVMRISGVTVTPVAAPIRPARRHSDGLSRWTTRTVLQVRTDNGLVGLGEVGPRVSQEHIHAVARSLVGESPFALGALRERLAAGKFYSQDAATVFAAVEIACLDLQGKFTGLSVSDLLGGTIREEIPLISYIYRTAETDDAPAINSAEDVVNHAKEVTERFGFRTIKLKGGAGPPEEDVEIVRALRAAFPEMRLRLDPNAAWTVETSLWVANALRDQGLEWLEDPTFGLEGMAEVTRRAGIPTATNMCLTHAGEFARAAAIRAVDVVLCDVWYSAGPRSARELAALCRAFGLGVGLHSLDEFGIGTAAMLHVAATLPGLPHAVDSHYHHLDDDLLAGGLLPIHNGAMRTPIGPGLGIQLDADRLEQFAEAYRASADDRARRRDPTRPAWVPVYPAW